MLYFENDYSEGACQQVLDRLIATNFEKLSPYGSDIYSDSAKEKIRAACRCPNTEVYFLCGGTQTNKVVIDAFLEKYEGVIAAATGHINLHEAGAIEATGHKVIELPQEDGKLSADVLEQYLGRFYGDENHPHMVFPGMVYISHPTEYGTLYRQSELQALSEVCSAYGIPLYLDGARLGYGLAAHETDVTLADIAKYCDAFYIGGTKVGALCGEAVVFCGKKCPSHLLTRIKQHGALLAKGRLLGVQFDTLFTDDLYLKIGRIAIETAKLLKEGLAAKGYPFFCDSPTNQIFIIMEDQKLNQLREHVVYSFWEKYDEDHTVIRLATSWATTPEDVHALLALL